jgi:hypothetical protein
MQTQAIRVQPPWAKTPRKSAETVALWQHPNRPDTDFPACHAGGRGFKSRPPRQISLRFFCDSTTSGVTRLEAVTEVPKIISDFPSLICCANTPGIVELAVA